MLNANAEPTTAARCGKQLAMFGADLAAGKADRLTGGEWSAKAWAFFLDFAKRQGDRPFMTEDVRMAAAKTGAVPPPPDGRAWGAITLRAVKGRLISCVNYAPNKDPSCHGSPKSVWVWVG